jgi:hypothetical protein
MRPMHTVARSSVVVVAACLLAAPAALGSNPATATLSSSAAGAKSVRMTIALHTELQCGRLTGGPLVVTFPRQVHVPGQIAAASVLIGSRASRSVTVAGHVVTVAMPIPRGVMCDSIGPGIAKVTFTRASGLANPASAGAFAVKLRHGSETFAAAFKIH